MPRATIHDVARVAGVSLSTVDRVLNGRHAVRKQTRDRVEEAVRTLGYVRNVAAANLSRGRDLRFTVLLPGGPNAFMRGLEDEVVAYAALVASDGVDVAIEQVPPFDTAGAVAALTAIDPAACDGLALVGVDTPEVRDAVGGLRAKGLSVVTLVSDLPATLRDHFVGIDNIWAGRTAARLLGRFSAGRSGRVAVVAGSMVLRDHAERFRGFRQVLAEDFPGLELMPPVEGLDDAATAEQLLHDALQHTSDVVAVYSLGAGNRGVVAALERAKLRVPTVMHELTPHSRAWLLDDRIDAVIRQDPAREARSAIRTLIAIAHGKSFDTGENQVGIEIFLKDNLP